MIVLAQALYLFAPLLVAATLSAIVLRFHLLRFARRAIDGGATWRGRRIFGESKTWRGVLVAVTGSAVAALGQELAFADIAGGLAVAHHDNAASALGLGALMGLGAMMGELPNSFIKRRLGIAPGKTTRGPRAVLFYVWDQIDLLTGAWPLIAFWVRPSIELVMATVVLALGLHPLISLFGWLLGARTTAR
ncbi:MAG: CDP-archaeol synthase [Deltaproteobacteria bacterium]|nr:CDP-archaeol synthase [Deltaproteobacteria bacterium]